MLDYWRQCDNSQCVILNYGLDVTVSQIFLFIFFFLENKDWDGSMLQVESVVCDAVIY